MTQTASSPQAEAEAFLCAWFDRLPAGQLGQVSAIEKSNGGYQPRFDRFVRRADLAFGEAMRWLRDRRDVYLAIHPRTSEAGDAGAVGSLIWLAADIDCGSVAHKAPGPTMAEARAKLARLPRPTMLVDSGHGLHAWWSLYGDTDQESWREAQAHVNALLGADPATLASTTILRVAGTVNFKVPDDPQGVRLLELDPSSEGYDIDQFLPARVVPIRPGIRPASEPATPIERAGGGHSKPAPHRSSVVERRVPELERAGDRAKEVPAALVLSWLGVELERDRCACPMHNGSPGSAIVGGHNPHVIVCFSGCRGPDGAPKTWTAVDLVMRIRSLDYQGAVSWLADRAGFPGFVAKGEGGAGARGIETPPTTGGAGGGNHQTPNGSGGGEGSQPRREITLSTNEAECANIAISALSEGSLPIYQRGGALVRLQTELVRPRGLVRALAEPKISDLPLPQVRSLLSLVAVFFEEKEDRHGVIRRKECHSPDWITRDIHTRGSWAGIRPLEGFCEAPIVRPDGSVLECSGYDEQTGLVFLPEAPFKAVSPDVGIDDAQAAACELLELVAAFPFESDAHRSAWLAALLTPFARYAFRGPAPLFMIDANLPGSGKSLLVDVISEIFSGRDMRRSVPANNEEEERKRITTLLREGVACVLIDNVSRPLGGDAIDVLLTSETWGDRLLGGNEMAKIPALAIWYATGNNIEIKGDLRRRVCYSRLVSRDQNPEDRVFELEDLKGHVRSNRGRLASLCCVILSAWLKHRAQLEREGKKPDTGLAQWGSFERWSGVVRGAIVWLGLPDPADTRSALAQFADTTGAALADLLASWPELSGPHGCTASEAISRLQDACFDEHGRRRGDAHTVLLGALGELCRVKGDSLPSAVHLGSRLRQLRDKVVGGVKLEGSEGRSNRLVWRVVSAT